MKMCENSHHRINYHIRSRKKIHHKAIIYWEKKLETSGFFKKFFSSVEDKSLAVTR